jgi:EpsI family protein
MLRDKNGIKAVIKLLIFSVFIYSFNRYGDKPPEYTNIFKSIPYKIGEWNGVDISNEAVKSFYGISDTTYIKPFMRKYIKDGTGDTIWVFMAHDLRGEGRNIHSPQFCYISQGWNILEKHEREININGRRFSMVELRYIYPENMTVRIDFFTYIMRHRILSSDIKLRLYQLYNKIRNRFVTKGNDIILIDISTTLEKDKDISETREELFKVAERVCRAVYHSLTDI